MDHSKESSTQRQPINGFFQPLKNQERIVATIQPYSSGGQRPDTIVQQQNYKPTKTFSPICQNLQESGVFDDDTLLLDVCNQCTQTEVGEFPVTEKASGDLCAEIQKLNRFRKKIEECVTKTSTKPGTVANLLSPNSSDQRRLQYYKERLELLENKVLVYESSGDLQVRRLAERLQREIQLEAWVKQLTERVDKLVEENLMLEEQKCEFEEAENDTRLHLQRLEVDLEILSQRNIELEMARDAAKANANSLQDTICKAQERIYTLEEHKNDLKHKMEMLTTFMPTILMFNSWKMSNRSVTSTNESKSLPSIPTNGHKPDMIQFGSVSEQEKYHELLYREKELKLNIAELNRAYNETLESADNLWAQMERDYKEKLAEAHDQTDLLKSKINMLEERLRNDSFCAQERITQLEESENSLQHRIGKLLRDHKDEQLKYKSLMDEYNSVYEELQKLKDHLSGAVAEQLEKEKKKIRQLQAELEMANKIQKELDDAHSGEVNVMETQIETLTREINHIGVSNGELKEEVATLEHRCVELTTRQRSDAESIKNLTDELQYRQEQLMKLKPKIKVDGLTLDQELRSAGVGIVGDSGRKLDYSRQKSGIEEKRICLNGVHNEPLLNFEVNIIFF